ncbi:MAG: hypothetical protein WC364_13185, partial [Eubacteriales bacterium]
MRKLILLFMTIILFVCFSAAADASGRPDQEPVDEQKGDRIELTSLRTETSRFYRNNDGTVTAEVDLKPGLKIDNTLVTGDSAEERYENKSNRFKVKFSRQVDKELLSLALDETAVSFELDQESSAVGYVYGEKIRYANLIQNIDAEYQVMDYGIKETLVLKDKEVPDKISFVLKTDNLIWEVTENGRIKFFSKKKNKLLFYLEPVSAVDSKGARCDAVSQNITEKGNNLQIDILINKDSLTDEQYPVTIDPTVTIIPDFWAAMDTYIEKPYLN